MAPQYVDMHFHLEFLDEPTRFLKDAAELDLGLLCVSCDIEGYEKTLRATDVAEGLAVPALGLHPWWIADGRAGEAEMQRFEELAPNARAFGELGLDFADKHTSPESHARQLEFLERACTAAAESSKNAGVRKPLSLHSVRAADEVLDVLEKTGCLEQCACIFHWFSGSTPQLMRAREAGCWFSINGMGMKTGRGREYSKLIPADKLLLETDFPAEDDAAFTAEQELEAIATTVELIEVTTKRAIRAQATDNALKLLS